MKRIDRETVQKILDTANIVEVVSDFVSLKRRGANYIGLCPFHNERTPSFSVSPSKGICKCFSCGKGGSPVNFIMEHEQMSFNEALRFLAKKYNIEIHEHDMTDEEREKESARETMFAANEFALKEFERTLTETADGRDIGLAYFRERGITDTAIKRFHLGYSLEKGNSLLSAATKAGFSEQTLIDNGLCVRRDDGSIYDRFKGRVIYPVHTISGKVVAFGGRTLRTDKKVAKYVNSPESIIYSKSRELYGLFQAKKSIVEKKKCILVEGYMDVISMSQLGIENVVASSGTSLTEGQIRLIHRFTDTVTVIYDSDPAGIKASLRGIDMLLAEGLKIKVVLLPDGDDPDSFAQSHSLTEVEEYLAAHETDFIRFKTDILLKGVENDPIRRSQVITEIVASISVIPDEITRSVYVKECSRTLDIDEKVLLREIKKQITGRIEKLADQRRREQAKESLGDIDEQTNAAVTESSNSTGSSQLSTSTKSRQQSLMPLERELLRYVIKYGMIELQFDDESGTPQKMYAIDYIKDELEFEQIKFVNEGFREVFEACLSLSRNDWNEDSRKANEEITLLQKADYEEGERLIKQEACTLEQIKARETALTEQVTEKSWQRWNEFCEIYFIKKLASAPDDDVRNITTELAASKYHLSKYHSKFTRLETESDKLGDLLPRAIYGIKNAHLLCDKHELQAQLNELSRQNPSDSEGIRRIMVKITELDKLRREYALNLGERVVTPK